LRVIQYPRSRESRMTKASAAPNPKLPTDPFPEPSRPAQPSEQTPSDPVNVPPPGPDVIYPTPEPVGIPPAPDIQPVNEPPAVF
jgi:hypothetical protein